MRKLRTILSSRSEEGNGGKGKNTHRLALPVIVREERDPQKITLFQTLKKLEEKTTKIIRKKEKYMKQCQRRRQKMASAKSKLFFLKN